MSTCGAMIGAFATIFSFEKSRKWIIREGLKGISRAGSGASIARGLKKSRGLRKGVSWGRLVGTNGIASRSTGRGEDLREARVRAASYDAIGSGRHSRGCESSI